MTNKNNSIISGYITNLGKYNDGFLIGEWIDFPISKEDLAAALERIGISSEPDEYGRYYEEYFFTDWETSISGLAADFGEYPNISRINEIAEKIEEYGDLAEAVIEAFGVDDLMDNDPKDYIIWSAEDDYDLGKAIMEITGMLESIPDELRSYFNFAAYGENYSMGSNGGWCSAGYIHYIG